MPKRAFILGAGFSKPAGMPLATELLPLLVAKVELPAMQDWLGDLGGRLAWLSGGSADGHPFVLNIEQVFHLAHFHVEALRLRQHLASVGRRDGPGTPWKAAESVEAWLSFLQEALHDVLLERDDQADLRPIERWAEAVGEDDAVLTFNYDTLAERALEAVDKHWNHGTGRSGDTGIPVFKLHGSIDWIVAHRTMNLSRLDLIFDKKNVNHTNGNTGDVEDDYRLWRCRTRTQLRNWIEGRHVQSVPADAAPNEVGVAGLGAYKELHRVPGLGTVWSRGMRAVMDADRVVVVGFAMSDFDALAQMQFAMVARARNIAKQKLPVVVVDPHANQASEDRFGRVFRTVEFVRQAHETIDWSRLDGP